MDGSLDFPFSSGIWNAECNYIIITYSELFGSTEMAHIVKIGNSQGIRIPKPLVEQAKLEGKELNIQLVSDGLLISPKHEARKNWREEIEQSIANQEHEVIDSEWLDLPLALDDDLEW